MSPRGAAIVDGLRLWQVLEPRRLTDAYARFVGPAPADGAAHHAGFDAAMSARVITALAAGRSMAEIHAETNADMVDVAGKFRLDQRKRVVFAFGPYRGAVAMDHPSYLEWMLAKDFSRSTREVAQEQLDRYWASVRAGDDGDQVDETEDESASDGSEGELEPDEIPF